MKRKALGVTFGYSVGLFFASVIGNLNGIFIILSALLIFFIFCKITEVNLKDIATMLIPMVLAFCIYGFYNTYVYETLLKCNGTDGYFIGRINDISDYSDDNSRYILDGTINSTIDAEIIFYGEAYECKIGDTISFNGTFEEISGDYLFDSKSYYKSKNIFLSVSKADNIDIIQNNNFSLKRILYEYRDKMISQFKIKTDEESGAFLSAMVFGDKSVLEESSKTLLYRSGIGHIMAISGIHASIIATFLMKIMKKLHIGKKVSFIVMCVFLVLLTIIVESPVSVIRAGIMIAILYGADLVRCENDTFNSLAIAILLICLANPFAIHNQGFLLSVSGTYGIGVLAPYMTKNIQNKFVKNLLSMIYVSICVIPFSIIYFDEVSLISPITNIILIPLCSASLIIGLIYVLTNGIVNLLFIAEYLIKSVMYVTDFIGQSEWSYINGGSELVFILLICLFIFAGVYGIIRNKRKVPNILILTGIIFLFGFNFIQSRNEYNKLKLTVLGRNNNTAVVISYKGNTDIIDLSGHYKTPDYVRKYLSQNKCEEINNLILTNRQSSLYSSYVKSLELTDIENIMLSNDTYGKFTDNRNVVCYYDGVVEIKYDNYSIKYSDGVLFAEIYGYTVCVSPYKFNETADIYICYGNYKETDIPSGKFIFTDEYENYRYSGMNNFSLEFENNSEPVLNQNL